MFPGRVFCKVNLCPNFSDDSEGEEMPVDEEQEPPTEEQRLLAQWDQEAHQEPEELQDRTQGTLEQTGEQF